MRGPAVSLDTIKGLLLAQAEAVAMRYAPPCAGSWQDRGDWWTLNPGRPDRRVGSFVVHLRGPRAGRWQDFATGERGDLLDLIALAQGCSLSEAVREARAFLGLEAASPADLRRAERAAEEARARRAEAERRQREDRARASRAAQALWLSGRALAGTPAEAYLRDRRGIDLRSLGRQPGALRYVERCRYQHVDRETGEVIEGEWPAMVGVIVGRGGRTLACHRTYLALAADGRWGKAALPEPKKVLGPMRGGWIVLSNGVGPRGGKGARLAEAEPGAAVFVAEGIETGLSAVMLMPEARVLAAVSLSNMALLDLPPQVGEVVLLGDGDQAEEARAAFGRAVAAHQRAGRRVRVRRSPPGMDLNDEWRAAVAAEAGREEARSCA